MKTARNGRLLSWYAPRRCWRKVYQGKAYYVGKGSSGPDDEKGYQRGLEEFYAIKRRVDEPEPEPEEVVQSVAPATDDGKAALEAAIRDAFASVVGSDDIPKNVLSFASDYSTLSNTLPEVPTPQAPGYLKDRIKDYLSDIKQRVEIGGLAITSYREYEDKLEDFVGYARQKQVEKLDEVTGHFLNHYRKQQLDLVISKKIGAFTAKKRLAHTKRFLEWCRRLEYIEQVPACVDKTYAQITTPKPTPYPFTKQQVNKLWKHTLEQAHRTGSYRNVLFVALGLNCGYRSGDIASLRHEHLFRRKGRWYIERGRNKTGSPQHHILWGVTIELLQAEMTNPKHHDLVLVDINGEPLVKEDFVKSKIDLVREAFKRIRRNMKWGPNTGHSCLRDTGADWLKKTFPQYPGVVSQYLAHMPQGMTTHYANQHYETLYECLDEMDKHYNLSLT